MPFDDETFHSLMKSFTKSDNENKELRTKLEAAEKEIAGLKEFNLTTAELKALNDLNAEQAETITELKLKVDRFHDHDKEDKSNDCKDCPLCFLEHRIATLEAQRQKAFNYVSGFTENSSFAREVLSLLLK